MRSILEESNWLYDEICIEEVRGDTIKTGLSALSKVKVISSNGRHPSIVDLQTSVDDMFRTVDDVFCQSLQLLILVPLIFQHSIVDTNAIISSGIVMLIHPLAGIL